MKVFNNDNFVGIVNQYSLGNDTLYLLINSSEIIKYCFTLGLTYRDDIINEIAYDLSYRQYIKIISLIPNLNFIRIIINLEEVKDINKKYSNLSRLIEDNDTEFLIISNDNIFEKISKIINEKKYNVPLRKVTNREFSYNINFLREQLRIISDTEIQQISVPQTYLAVTIIYNNHKFTVYLDHVLQKKILEVSLNNSIQYEAVEFKIFSAFNSRVIIDNVKNWLLAYYNIHLDIVAHTYTRIKISNYFVVRCFLTNEISCGQFLLDNWLWLPKKLNTQNIVESNKKIELPLMVGESRISTNTLYKLSQTDILFFDNFIDNEHQVTKVNLKIGHVDLLGEIINNKFVVN